MSHDVHWRHAIDCVVCVVKLPHVEKFSLLLLPLLLLFLLDDLSYSTHHQQPLFPHLEHAIEVLCYLVIAVFVFCIFLAGCFFPRRTPKKVPSVEFTMVLPQTFQEKSWWFLSTSSMVHYTPVISKPDRVMVWRPVVMIELWQWFSTRRFLIWVLGWVPI